MGTRKDSDWEQKISILINSIICGYKEIYFQQERPEDDIWKKEINADLFRNAVLLSGKYEEGFTEKSEDYIKKAESMIWDIYIDMIGDKAYFAAYNPPKKAMTLKRPFLYYFWIYHNEVRKEEKEWFAFWTLEVPYMKIFFSEDSKFLKYFREILDAHMEEMKGSEYGKGVENIDDILEDLEKEWKDSLKRYSSILWPPCNWGIRDIGEEKEDFVQENVRCFANYIRKCG